MLAGRIEGPPPASAPHAPPNVTLRPPVRRAWPVEVYAVEDELELVDEQAGSVVYRTFESRAVAAVARSPRS